MKNLFIAADAEDLFTLAADEFVKLARESIQERGRFVISLSGGSTPKAFYHLLASERYRDDINWSKIVFFFGDERFVPPAAEQSNFRLALLHLFKPLNIDLHNIYRWKTELADPKAVARIYEQTMKDVIGTEAPYFDLFLLGIGEDGHVASLFPHSKALSEHDHLAVPNWIDKLRTWRLTMTYPVINSSRNIFFLVSGEAKAEILKAVLDEKKNVDLHPAQGVRPKNGRLVWYVDEPAAKYIKHKTSSVHN